MYDHIAKLKTRKIDNKVVRNLVAMAIIEHDIPFFFFFWLNIEGLGNC